MGSDYLAFTNGPLNPYATLLDKTTRLPTVLLSVVLSPSILQATNSTTLKIISGVHGRSAPKLCAHTTASTKGARLLAESSQSAKRSGYSIELEHRMAIEHAKSKNITGVTSQNVHPQHRHACAFEHRVHMKATPCPSTACSE